VTVHEYVFGDRPETRAVAEKLAGVVAAVVGKLTQEHPLPSDAVTFTPLLGFVLVTDIFSVGGRLPPIW
jgi:hypothetical protein